MSILKTAQTNLENAKIAKQVNDDMMREEVAKEMAQKAARSLAASEYANRDIGYGISAREMAAYYGVPVNELSNVLQQQDNAHLFRGSFVNDSTPSSDEIINKYAADKRAYIDNAIAKNREYIANKVASERFGDTPGADGKYRLESPTTGGSDEYGTSIVSDVIGKVQDYFINRPRISANEYNDNIDKSLAAEWMKSYKGQ